jgi:hypothetical protein
MPKHRTVATFGIMVPMAWAASACSSSTSAGPSHSSATGSALDAGTDAAGGSDSGTDGAPCSSGTLYTRLGGHSGIRSAVNAVVAGELGDPDIQSYFFNQLQSPVPSTSPTGGEIEECLTDQLGAAAGGPEVYPPVGGAYDDGGGNLGGPAGTWMCRDMATIHQKLLISGGTFDKFITIAGGVLTAANVCPDDITTVAAVLTGARPSVVDAPLADAGYEPYPGDSGAASSALDAGTPDSGGTDGGTDGDPCAAGTLYSRLGGHAGIRSAVNAVVAGELGDSDIKSYFFNQLRTPVPSTSPTGGEIEECLTDQLGAAAGGPEVYPPVGGAYDDGGGNLGGPAGTWMCRDMATIHQKLLISGGTFDKFITIAGGVLTAANVCPNDITAVAMVLTGARSSVVYAPLADAGYQAYPGDAGGN